MSTPLPPAASNGRAHGPLDGAGPGTEPADRVGTLRGAGVQVDARRVGQVALGLVLAALAVLTIAFTVIGVHKNQQADRLHNDGVPVTFTVTGCLGLLGGSGSNAAGYSCHGTYGLDGHRYTELLPGTAFHAPGSAVSAVAVPGDPALVSPTSIVRNEHSSSSVFILPAVLGLLFVLLLGMVLLLQRRRVAADGPGGSQPAG
jgi:hypothetical protein